MRRIFLHARRDEMEEKFSKHYLMSIQIDSQSREIERKEGERIQSHAQVRRRFLISGRKIHRAMVEQKKIDGKLKIKFLRRTFYDNFSTLAQAFYILFTFMHLKSR